MIATKRDAAILAAQMSTICIHPGFAERKQFSINVSPTAEEDFDEVLRYRFHGEAWYGHLRGRQQEDTDEWRMPPWSHCEPERKLAFTLFCQLVPILNALIAPPAPVIEEPKPALPGRGFESINEDSSNTGTIYEREDWSKHQAGQAPAAAQEGSTTEQPTGAAMDDRPHGDQGLRTEPGNLEAPGPDAGTGEQRAADPSVSAGEQLGDVTQNTDPEPYVTYEGQGEGGEVVDEDDDDTEGAEGGSVEGDANTPAVTDQQPKRRKR